jgi:hypothetical protein
MLIFKLLYENVVKCVKPYLPSRLIQIRNYIILFQFFWIMILCYFAHCSIPPPPPPPLLTNGPPDIWLHYLIFPPLLYRGFLAFLQLNWELVNCKYLTWSFWNKSDRAGSDLLEVSCKPLRRRKQLHVIQPDWKAWKLHGQDFENLIVNI